MTFQPIRAGNYTHSLQTGQGVLEGYADDPSGQQKCLQMRTKKKHAHGSVIWLNGSESIPWSHTQYTVYYGRGLYDILTEKTTQGRFFLCISFCIFLLQQQKHEHIEICVYRSLYFSVVFIIHFVAFAFAFRFKIYFII